MCNMAIETQTGEFVDLSHQLYFFVALDVVQSPRKFSVRIGNFVNGKGGIIAVNLDSEEEAKKELLNFLKRGNYVIREYKPIMSDKEK